VLRFDSLFRLIGINLGHGHLILWELRRPRYLEAVHKIRDTIFVHANSSGWKGDLQPFLCLGAGAALCALSCDDGFDRIPRRFGAFWPRLRRPHHQVGASEGEKAALVIMTFLA
jgi:hypothetical protein